MNALALAILFLIRIVIPATIMLMLGEWMRRREENYWYRM